MNKEEATSLCTPVLPRGSWSIVSSTEPGPYPECILEFTEGRVILSIRALSEALLLDKRYELASALLGEGVSND
jgi:hypothetical protein